MELLSIAGVLVRRRWLVVLGALLAATIGAKVAGLLAIGGGSQRSAASGVAQTRVMLDDPKAIVADLQAPSDTVGKQAALLAEVMTGDAQRAAIARRAAIRPDELGMQRLQLTKLIALSQLAQRGAQASATIARSYVVNVWTATPLPIVTIDVVAPSGAAAARIANATRDALAAVVAAGAPSERRSLVLKPLGAVRSLDVPPSTRSPRRGLVAALAFFLFWCCAVVVLHGLLRWWRGLMPAAVATASDERSCGRQEPRPDER
jgi:hypothetical protein